MKCAAAWVWAVIVAFGGPAFLARAADESLKLEVSWGHRSPVPKSFFFTFRTNNVALSGIRSFATEESDKFSGFTVTTTAGAGDVDGVEFTLHFEPRTIQPITNLHSIWGYLLSHSDPDTVRRLQNDPAYRPDDRQLAIQMDPSGTSGFSVTVDQLLRQGTFWVPELDVFLSANGRHFSDELKAIAADQGKRIREQVNQAEEPSYQTFAGLWEDMGSPSYRNPHAVPPGHIVGLTWDSVLYKFGIDRWAGVRADYGNPDRFSLSFRFGSMQQPGTNSWRGQKLEHGLPIMTTAIEDNGIRYEVEQFAFPVDGPPTERKGDLPMVLMQKLSIANPGSEPKQAVFSVRHERRRDGDLSLRQSGTNWCLQDVSGLGCLVAVQGRDLVLKTNEVRGPGTNSLTFQITVPAGSSREFIVKLPSPVLSGDKVPALLNLDYTRSREQTVNFWEEWLNRGVRFQVADKAVNELFRANLWHALRLPRRHAADSKGQVAIDLPYSNFAYDQRGIPWPVNQAVYVDYMLYDLRGYHSVSAEELEVMFRANQEPNGHVKGYANWGVYTPGMLYSVANHFLLSGDTSSFEHLLPNTLRAADWCLEQIKAAEKRTGAGHGLVLRPLNDLSHEDRAWAFNQAYFYAGLEALGRALAIINHARAAECRAVAVQIKAAVENEFGRACLESPLVQLRDHTWTPYVPSDALTPGRQMRIWYPTDVDTGPLHLSRLQALDPAGPLTAFMLNDHEDNLFLGGLSMANEPVYNQHATAYLLRDEAPMAVRAFYSMMACAFSQSVFEPVEHRWGWGQYFGPPSTDGAWFELYRNMLLREMDENTLILMQAAPRAWLGAGKAIRVQNAPTWFGKLSFETETRSGGSEIRVAVNVPPRRPPSTLLVRVRHPERKQLREIQVNGAVWRDFDAGKEWIRINPVSADKYEIRAAF